MAAATRALLIVATLTGTIAGPLSFWGDEVSTPVSTSCASQMCPDSVKFSYEAQKTYQYTYSSQIITTVGGSMDQFSSLNMAALVNLEVLSPCEMAIRLTDVSLQDIEPGVHAQPGHVEQAWDFKRALQARPMRFSFLDGTIAEVCPEVEDEVWVKNVKRAIISALQNRMPTLETNAKLIEEDIAGTCEVEYELDNRGWGSRSIRKTKDLLSCTDRQHVESAFQGTPYRVPSKLQSLPILKGTHECTQTVKSNGILQSSLCHESHIFRPFSKYDSGALTNITSTLTFNSAQNNVRTTIDTVQRRESLKFEHSHEEPTTEVATASRSKAQRVLRQLCRTSDEDVRPETPAIFAQLVREMRNLDSANLDDLHQVVKSGRLCDKAHGFFRDAVPMLGTATSVAFIRDMITENDVTTGEADVWLSSLAFISLPTVDMLREAKPMLQMEPRRSKVALAVSSILNTFCKLNPNCESEREVRDIISILEEDLRYNCMIDNEVHYKSVMMALKGLGNSGHASGAAAALNRCAMNNDAPMTIRIAALNAFRRMPCEADKSEFLSLLRDTNKDSELRITAYLALMACPDSSVISSVADVLRREEVNQVGSFIWTHLTNLMESSHVFKREIRAIVENQDLEREFDLDKRKFSRNYEWSAFSEWMNSGAMLESNMIWSEKSFIPRSAMLNMTVDMFGDSFNLVEAGGRLEGFEDIVAKVFGHSDNEAERERRSSNNAINTLDREYNIDESSDPEGSYYLRFFGNEISYGSFRGLNFDSLWERLNYLQWLINLSKEHNYDITKSFMFLESSMVVPTVAGLPLKLEIEGSTVMSTKVNGHLDLRQMASSPRSINIQGTIQPSAALEISGTMGVDAFMAKTGVKMTNTLHTSTMTTANIQLQNGEIFSMNFDTPREKIEVFTAQSKFYLIFRDEEREQVMQNDVVENEQCLSNPTMTNILGMELCGRVAYPAVFSEMGKPWPPLAGPMELKVELLKRDTMTGYTVLTKWIKDARGAETAIATFNTPGSRVNRELTLELNLNREQKNMRFNLRSPWKRLEIGGDAMFDRSDMKQFNAHVIIDGSTEYRIASSLGIENSRSAMMYSPQLEITIPNRAPVRVSGSLMSRGLRRSSIELHADNVFAEPLVVAGSIIQQETSKRDRYTVEFNTQSGYIVSGVSGYVNLPKDGNGGSSRVEVDYRLGETGRDERMVMSSKWRDDDSRRGRTVTITGAVSSTKYASFNSDFEARVTKTPTGVITHVECGSEEPTNRIVIDQSFGLELQGAEKSAEGSLQLQWPAKHINYNIETQQIFGPRRQQSSATIQYGSGLEASYLLSHELSSGSLLESDLRGNVNFNGRSFAIAERLQEISRGQYRYSLNAEKDSSRRLSVTGDYGINPRHELSGTIDIAGQPDIVVNAHFNPILRNIESRVEVRRGSKTYLLEHVHEFNGRLGQFDSSMSWKVGCSPYLAHITAEAHRSGDRLTTQMEAKWDAERDPSKKFSLSNALSLSKSAPSMELRAAWWPRQFIELNGGAQLTTGGYYSTETQVRSNATLRSSFENFSDLRFVYNVNKVAQALTVHTEAQYAPGKTITYDATFGNEAGSTEAQITVATPFSGYRRSRFTHEGTTGSNRIVVSQTLEIDSSRGSLEVELSGANVHDMEASVAITTPIRGYEQMSLSAMHRDNDRKYTSSLRAALNQQELSAAFSMDHARQGYYITNNGELTVITPFAEFRKNKLSWNHKNTESIFKCHHEVELKGRRSVIDIDATQSVGSTRRINLSSSITSPYIEDVRLEFSHSHEMNSLRNIDTTGSLRWSRNKNIALNSQFDIVPQESCNKAITFTSSFEGFERIIYEDNAAYSNNVMTKNVRVEWAPNKEISMDSRIEIQSPSFDANIRLQTPFEQVEDVSLTMSNNKESGLWVSRGSLAYSPRQTVTLITKLGIDSMKKLSIDLKTPFTAMRSLEFDIQHTGSLRNFDTRASFECLPSLGVFSLASRLNADNWRNINGNVNLQTPFNDYRTMRLVFSHTTQNTMTTEVSFEMPRYTCSFTETIVYNNILDFTTNTVVEYSSGQAIQLETAMHVSPGLNMQLHFQSPFMQDVRLEVTHTGPLTNFQCALLFESQLGNINGNAQYQLRDRQVTASATLDMPLFRVPRIAFNADTTGYSSNALQYNAQLTYGSDRYTAETSMDVGGSRKTASVTLTTPIYGYNRMTGTAAYENTYDDMSASFEMACDRHTMNGAFELSNQRNTKSASLSLSTSFTDDIRMSVSHDGDFEVFRSHAEATVMRQSYSADFNVDMRSAQKSASVTMNLPFRDYRQVTIGLTHTGTIQRFHTTTLLSVNRESYSTDVNVDIRSNEKVIAFTTSTPDGDISYALNFDGVPAKFNAKVKAGLFGQMSTITFGFDILSTTKTVSFTSVTPAYGYENIAVDMAFKGSPMKFDTSYTASLNRYRSTGHWTTDLIASTKRVEMTYTTPIPGYENVNLVVSHSGSLLDCEFNVEATKNRETISLETNINLVRQEKTITVSLRTPIPGYERSMFTFSNEGSWSIFRNEITIELNGQRMATNVLGRFTEDVKTLTISLESPMKNVAIEWMHNGGLLNHRTQTTLDVDGSRYSCETELSVSRTDVTSALVLATPHQLLRRFALQLAHSGKRMYFRDSLTMELNDNTYAASTLFRWMEKTNTLRMNAEVTLDGTAYSVNFQHRGELSDMEDSFAINFGSERVQGNSQISIGSEGVQATASVSTPFKGLRNVAASVNHNNRYGEFTSSGSLSMPAISYEINHSRTARGVRSSGSLDLPITALPRVEYEINHSGNANDFETSVSGSANGRRVGVNMQHSGNLQQFRTVMQIESPFSELPSCVFTLAHRGNPSDFEEQLTLEYNNRQLEGVISYSSDVQNNGYYYGSSSSSRVANVRITTPFPNFNGEARAELRSEGASYTLASQVTHKRRQVLDVEYTLDLGDVKSVFVDMRVPEPMTANLRYTQSDTLKRIYYDLNRQGRSVVITSEYKTEGDLVGVMLDMELPSGRTTIGTNYTLSSTRFAHVLDVNNRYISKIEGTFEGRGSRSLFDARVIVSTPPKSIDITMSHQKQGASCVSDITFGNRQPLTLRHEFSQSGNDFTSDLTIAHPSLSSDISVTTRGTIDLATPVFDGSIAAVVENERINFVGRIADESNYSRKRYVATCHLTHPGTYTDFEYSSSLEKNSETVALSMQTSYKMTRDRSTRVMQLRTNINKLRKEIEYVMATPLLNVNLNGRIASLDMERGILEATYRGQINGNNVQGEVNVNEMEPSLDVQVVSDDFTARLMAGYENDQLINIEAFHIQSGNRIQDLQLKLNLLNSQLLKTRVFIRPQLFSDIIGSSPSYGRQGVVTSAVAAFSDDLVYKQQYAQRSFRPVIEAISDAKDVVDQEVQAMFAVVRRAFYEDRFYMRTAYRSYEEMVYSIKAAVRSTINDITLSVEASREALRQKVADLRECSRNAIQWASAKWVEASEGMTYHAGNAAQGMSDLYTSHAHPHVTRMSEYFGGIYSSHVEPMVNNDRVRRVMSIAASEYVTPIAGVYQGVVTKYNQALIKAMDLWREIEDTDQYRQVKQWAVTSLEHTQWWYEYLAIEELIVAKLEELRGYSIENMISTGLQIVKDYSGLDKSRFTVYNPRGGEIELEISLPFEMRNLRTIPDIDVQQYLNTVDKYVKKYVPDLSDFCIWDSYYAYKPPTSIYELMPPFKAHASITGAQSFMTFDHRFMEFSGECSYLLARDFIDGKFSVVVNYDNVHGQKTKKSITVISGDDEVEIYPDSKVLLNKRRSELPIDLPKTSVIRDGDFIKVVNKHGLEISCNLPYDSCKIEVSGFYYGRTAGLLGTYDNEPSTDMMMTNKLQASSPEEFANSWTVGRRCSIRNNAHIDSYPSTQRETACRKLFVENSSIFRPCFRVVDPAAALKMCIDKPMGPSNSIEDETDVCQSAFFYSRECKDHGVALKMPEECVKCSLTDGRKFSHGDNVTIAAASDYQVPQSADVVFVMSHGECNREVTERIGNMVNLLERGMQRDGLSNNRYALVGFGGDNAHLIPHAHTMAGQVFSDSGSLISAVENNFEIMSQDTTSEDAMTAIKYAANLKFRAGVSKSVIVLPCFSCAEKATYYDELHQLLTDRDVRLHVVMDHDFSIRARTVKTSFIFGVDRSSLFNAKHVGETPLVGAQDMRQHVVMPKDICAALAEESDGSVFNVAKMTESRPYIQKKFIDVLTRLVVKKAEPTDCQICECVEDKAGVGKSICRRCVAIPPKEDLLTNLQNLLDDDDTEDEFEQDFQKYINTNEPNRKYRNKKQRTKYSRKNRGQ